MEITEEMESYAEFLRNESPKVDFAIKNLLSLLLAKSLANNLYDTGTNKKKVINTESGLYCTRIFIKHLNSLNLPNAIEWGSLNPQLQNQTSIERMNQLIQYKVAVILLEQVKLKGGKISQLFGRKFLIWTNALPQISTKVLAEHQNSPYFDALSLFFDALGKSLEGMMLFS
jgi:hypothetical protein